MSKEDQIEHWNYRVVHHKHYGYGIYEVYFTPAGEIVGWIYNVDVNYFNTAEELERNIQWMLDAFKKPVIEYDTLIPTMGNQVRLSTRPDTEDDANPLYDKQL